MNDEVARAKERALRLLAVRSRSTRELEERLRRLGFGEEAIGAALAGLTSSGLLDDAAFARAFAAWRLRGRPVGRRKILHDLIQRGIDRQAAEEALAAVLRDEGEESELERALRALERRAGKAGGSWNEKDAARAARFLQGRGFSSETIRKALARFSTRG